MFDQRGADRHVEAIVDGQRGLEGTGRWLKKSNMCSASLPRHRPPKRKSHAGSVQSCPPPCRGWCPHLTDPGIAVRKTLFALVGLGLFSAGQAYGPSLESVIAEDAMHRGSVRSTDQKTPRSTWSETGVVANGMAHKSEPLRGGLVDGRSQF
jgi:hypothetical protein